MIYSINYDLKRPGQDYKALWDAIKTCGDWWHYLGSTWLVDSTLTAQGIWDRLAPHVDANDRVFVIGVTCDKQGWLPGTRGTGSTAALRSWRRRGNRAG